MTGVRARKYADFSWWFRSLEHAGNLHHHQRSTSDNTNGTLGHCSAGWDGKLTQFCGTQAPKAKKAAQPEQVATTLGPQVREGELVFGVAHIFAVSVSFLSAGTSRHLHSAGYGEYWALGEPRALERKAGGVRVPSTRLPKFIQCLES